MHNWTPQPDGLKGS